MKIILMAAANFFILNSKIVKALTLPNVSSAKELRVNANEIGVGWRESFVYVNNPVDTLKKFYKKIGELDTLEPDKLRESRVKDCYFLFLKRVSPKSLVEIDVFVFEGVDGAKKFFKFHEKPNEYAGYIEVRG